MPLNTWTHLAATYDGSTVRLYVNGALVDEQSRDRAAWPHRPGRCGIGGNAIWGEYVQGVIDEVRVYNRAARTLEEIQSDMTTPVGGTPLPDTMPPTVSVTAPAAGRDAGGHHDGHGGRRPTTSASSACSSCSTACRSGPRTSTAPYSISWNTTGVADGPHTLSARARDAAGNTATAVERPGHRDERAGLDAAGRRRSRRRPPAPTLSGTVTITANASDNVGGRRRARSSSTAPQIGAEDLAAPYAISWNTATVANGSHTLTARARDAAGNTTTSAGVTVTVSNTAPTSLVAGVWLRGRVGHHGRRYLRTGQYRDHHERDLDDRGAIRQGAVVQRHLGLGHGGRRELARSHDRHDARGVGQSGGADRLPRR